jgi:hypothetical protein
MLILQTETITYLSKYGVQITELENMENIHVEQY